jgi:hypothetical protein
MLKKNRLIQVFITLLLCSPFSPPFAMAVSSDEQTTQVAAETPHVFEYLKLKNTWLASSNPAGMAFTEMYDLGNSYFSHYYNDGNFYRPQEAGRTNQFGFTTERFQALNQLRFKGAFTFHTTGEYDRKWGVLTDPFLGTPYVFADESGGDWAKQYYNLNAGMSSGKLFDLFYAGADVDYVVHTGARQADPRPLNNTYFIHVKSGVIFPIGQRASIGLSGVINNRQEDISISVRNQDFQHRWFKMRGLGEYRTGLMSAFSRSYSTTTLGGGLQFAYNLNTYQILAEVNYYMQNGEAIDGSSTFQHGGEYDETRIEGFFSFKFNGPSCLHLLKGTFDLKQGTGIEHSQNYDIDEEQWVTFATTTRYLGDRYLGGLQYNYFRTNGMTTDFNWMAGLQADIERADLRFLLPNSSQLNTFAKIKMQGKKNIAIGNNMLHIGLSAGYKLSLDDDLSLHPELMNSERTVISEMVTIPDYDYLITDYTSFGIDLKYNFSLLNRTKNNFYIGLQADKYYLTDESNAGFAANGRNYFKARIGMIY